MNFLRAYRATAHTKTGESPHQLLFNRPPHTRFSQIFADTSTPDNTDTIIRDKDSTAKEKMKSYADKKGHARDHSLQIGDTVLIRQQKKNKLTSHSDSRPYSVIQLKGSMITAERSDHKMTLHVTFFKKDFIIHSNNDYNTPTPIIQPPRQVQQPPQQPQPQRYNMRSNRRPPKRFGFDD